MRLDFPRTARLKSKVLSICLNTLNLGKLVNSLHTPTAPLKKIEYGFGMFSNKMPIYPIFYLLKGDYVYIHIFIYLLMHL